MTFLRRFLANSEELDKIQAAFAGKVQLTSSGTGGTPTTLPKTQPNSITQQQVSTVPRQQSPVGGMPQTPNLTMIAQGAPQNTPSQSTANMSALGGLDAEGLRLLVQKMLAEAPIPSSVQDTSMLNSMAGRSTIFLR